MSVCLFVRYTNPEVLSDHHEIWYTGRWTQEGVNKKKSCKSVHYCVHRVDFSAFSGVSEYFHGIHNVPL